MDQIGKGFRYYVYFRRGHATYIGMALSLGNTVGIWFILLGLNQFFPSIIEFAMMFIPTYVITCIILGWQDFKRGVYQREIEIQRATNEITKEILSSLSDITQRLTTIEELLTE